MDNALEIDSTVGHFTSHTYKVVLVGDGGTGKSSYLARLQSEGFHQQYVATMGVERHKIHLQTSHGECHLDVWDTAGQEKNGCLRDEYYQDADAALVFCDVTSRVTFRHVLDWYRDIIRVSPDIPVVLCANKIDCVDERKVKATAMLSGTQKTRMAVYEVSVKDRVGITPMLEYLLQQMTKEPALRVTSSIDGDLLHNMEDINLAKPTKLC